MVRVLPLLKFDNYHLCHACKYWKQSKKGHPVLIEKYIFEPLELLHIDLCGPSAVEMLHHKKYILVIFDDYTRFTWGSFLRSTSKTTSELINIIKGIKVLKKLQVQRVRNDNGTEFTNATLKKILVEKVIEHNSFSPTLHKKMVSLNE